MGTPPYEPFDQEFLGSLAPHCRIVASASAGYNEFPIQWFTDNNIWFCNTRNAVAESTANMAMLLILGVLRDAFRAETDARNGSWKKRVSPSLDPSGMSLGIVGMGAIGRSVANKAAVAFNMEVHYHSTTRLSPEQEAQYGTSGAKWHPTLHSMLAAVDVVSLHCPLKDSTTGLMSRTEFAAMKEGAFVVNTSRGPVIDEEALIEALESGKICRAGLDVFCHEPNIHEYFKASDKVICQPHMGGLTRTAFAKAEMECFENIRSLFATGKPLAPVNRIM
jgi:lactate dehydrogenase-like 2-hydroxyacid dehydrogenase